MADNRRVLEYTTYDANNLLGRMNDYIGDAPEFEVRDSSNPYHKYDIVKKDSVLWSCLSDTFSGAWSAPDWGRTNMMNELRSMRGTVGQYETVVVNVSKNKGDASLAGITIHVAFGAGSQSESFDSSLPASGTLRFLVPIGDVYQIQMPVVSGYTVRNSEVYKASMNQRVINIRYEQLNTGIYVIDDNGLETDIAMWDTAYNSRAVFLKYTNSQLNPGGTAKDNSIIMQKNGSFTSRQFTPDTTHDFANVPNYTTSDAALLDFSGSDNCENWYNDASTTYLALYNEGRETPLTLDQYLPAVMYARSVHVSFMGGTVTKYGYVPSMGQLQAIKDNRDDLNDAFVKIGGNQIPAMGQGTFWWSSSEYSAAICWYLNNGSVNYDSKNDSRSVVVLFDLAVSV